MKCETKRVPVSRDGNAEKTALEKHLLRRAKHFYEVNLLDTAQFMA